MIITIKNLQQQTFLVDVDPEKTVVELKEQIFNEKGEEYPVEKQNLIYAGVILDDEKTIASYNISSNKFLVVMIKRDLGLSPSQPDESGVSKKTAEKQSNNSGGGGGGQTDATKVSSGTDGAGASGVGGTATDVAAANKESKSIDKGKTGSSTDTTAVATAAAAAAAKKDEDNKASKENTGESDSLEPRSSTSTRTVESVLLMGEEYNRMVNSLMEMGYSKDLVERALQASYNNPERAVEYLICGIPSAVADAGLNAAEVAVAAEVAEVGDVIVPEVPDTDAEATEDPLEFLRSQPQFVQMRALIQQNPDLLNAVLQQIGLTNPALLQLITENQESFLNMLNEPIEGPNPLDPAFFVSLADRRRRAAAAAGNEVSADGGVGGQTDSNAASTVFQNRNAQDDTINRSGGGDGNVDGVQMVDRIPEVSASDAASAAGDRLRARAAGFAAALGQADATGIEAAGRVRTDQNVGRTVNRSGGGGGGSGGGGGASGGLPTIRLTPQDQAAIERLTALGFPEALVVQAYFACDKNETLAANFLLNTGLDD